MSFLCVLKIECYKKGRAKTKETCPWKDKGKCFEFSSHEEYLTKTIKQTKQTTKQPNKYTNKHGTAVRALTLKGIAQERNFLFIPKLLLTSTNSKQSNSASSAPEKPKNFMIYPEGKQLNADPLEDDKQPLPGTPLDRFTERKFA